ncbi:hypothetical protein [Clostridium sp. ZS2-4]|uniref:hypothetical protein n=1 Tax=Clostridium sp. ZS2-4 TaxID=2987703 RepID=UPI00227A4BC6|nr:hypothetical protein [Clostridium sp. ZS2-4]MCY6354201.1 hypothetical protein [Clostridium sp. ZS2-4]
MDKDKLDILERIRVFLELEEDDIFNEEEEVKDRNEEEELRNRVTVKIGTKEFQYINNFTDEQYETYREFTERLDNADHVLKYTEIDDKCKEWLTKNNINKYMQEQMDKRLDIEKEMEIMESELKKEGNVIVFNPKYIQFKRKKKKQEEIWRKFEESVMD